MNGYCGLIVKNVNKNLKENQILRDINGILIVDIHTPTELQPLFADHPLIIKNTMASQWSHEEKKVIAPRNGKKSIAVLGAIAPWSHIIGEYASFVNMVQTPSIHSIRTDFFFNKFTANDTQLRLPGA